MVDGQGQAGLVVSEEKRVFDTNAGSNSCKSEPTLNSTGNSPLCPQCKSKKVWRAAHRYSVYGDKIQRWLCRDCGLRFSDPNDVKKSWSNQEKAARSELSNEIKMAPDIVTSSQICVTETKNLVAEQQTTEVLQRNESGDFKQKSLNMRSG
jgi:ribosomal protein L37AE/L43A